MSIAGSTFCGDCQAENSLNRRTCWLCHKPLVPGSSPVEIATDVAAFEEPLGGAQKPAPFTLGSLMLLITLIAVCFGVFRIAPGLAIPLLIIVTPALFRTFASSARRKARGEQLSVGDKALAFLGSLGLMFLIAIAAFMSFFITCWITCVGALVIGGEEIVFFAGLIIGVLLAIGISVWMFILFWPRRG